MTDYKKQEQRHAYHKAYMKEYRKTHKTYVPSNDKPKKYRTNWTKRNYLTNEEREMYQRADHMARNYRRIDAKKGYDISNNITGDWIYEHVFKKQCLYCNNSDWEVLGCDRIDNSKPHTPNNVVPCCLNCNNKRHKKDFMAFFLTAFMENDILY